MITRYETEIEAHPTLPTVRLVRDFDAPVDRVYRAWVDPVLVVQWMGPRSITMEIDVWDIRRGGSYRYVAIRDGEPVAHFFGSIHEACENELLVQTFGFDEMPGAVSLDTATFIDLGDGRTRVDVVSLVPTMEARDGMLSSGMDVGVREGYEKLDELLAAR